jgi:hypothetical protein
VAASVCPRALWATRAKYSLQMSRMLLACLGGIVLVVLVGVVGYNWRRVSCSMADQAACPSGVRYQDIRFPGQETDGHH